MARAAENGSYNCSDRNRNRRFDPKRNRQRKHRPIRNRHRMRRIHSPNLNPSRRLHLDQQLRRPVLSQPTREVHFPLALNVRLVQKGRHQERSPHDAFVSTGMMHRREDIMDLSGPDCSPRLPHSFSRFFLAGDFFLDESTPRHSHILLTLLPAIKITTPEWILGVF